MAGYSKLYCIGGVGGFMGSDGINPIRLQIWVGNSDRQWMEAHYFDNSVKALSKIKTLIPESPNHPYSLLDACLAFYPAAFRNCPSMAVVEQKLAETECLDFHRGKSLIPAEWQKLRKEAEKAFQELHFFEAKLQRYADAC
ncbi:MAG: hypothetical protein K2X27_01875 [Candidatus Obscuribacterales bacterium]|nr:hypothetical protein [Candidatus Obscuribacterales bacterium]